MEERIDVVNLGLALGLTWALGIVLLGLSAWLLDWGRQVVYLIATVYIGYAPSLLGALIGGLYAVVDGFLGGVVIAWLYNKLHEWRS